VRWGNVLDRYGFTECDDLDLVLIEGIQRGFFDEDKLLQEAAKYQKNALALQGNASLEEAWRPFHESFDNNVDEVVTKLFDGSVKGIKYASLGYLNATVSMLKELGAAEKAADLIKRYASERGDESGLFDLSNHPLSISKNINDPDVLALCCERAVVKALPSPVEACKNILNGNWSEKDEEALLEFTADEFYSLFRKLRGTDLDSVIEGTLSFRKFGNEAEQQKLIRGRAEEALKRIAKESVLQRCRMRRYRLNLD
jgi:hypothetical protein